MVDKGDSSDGTDGVGRKAAEHRRMKRMIKWAYCSVKAAHPAGCLIWLQDNDPNRITELQVTIEGAKRAFLDGDPEALRTAFEEIQD